VTRDLVVLGSTGSIGTQALDVAAGNPDRFNVVALAASGCQPALLAEQAARFGVQAVAIHDPAAAGPVRTALAEAGAGGTKLLTGPDSVAELAGWPCDVVLNAVAGAAGLRATLAALDAGRRLALANKESLIVGGPLLAGRTDRIVPVDSEHSALAQCLRSGSVAEVSRLILTASGGPFRGRKRNELAAVTPAQALAHPTWDMGPLVTVNSATLVNKGLEVIEAHLLFGLPLERIHVVVHPQSVVHSMVEFADGATVAQASPPDMHLPIALALAWPERVPAAAPAVDWTIPARWDFEPLDSATFPAVDLARSAAAAGGTAPAVYNAANEECVAGFLAGRLGFLDIVDTVAAVLGEHQPDPSPDLDGVLAADAWARRRAAERNAAERNGGDRR
jgi:1-deoxy-D-xylulose-5-phosphate reductoisomerase